MDALRTLPQGFFHDPIAIYRLNHKAYPQHSLRLFGGPFLRSLHLLTALSKSGLRKKCLHLIDNTGKFTDTFLRLFY